MGPYETIRSPGSSLRSKAAIVRGWQRSGMKLSRHHCDGLALDLRVNREGFSEREFFKDPRLSDFHSEWEKGESLKLLHHTGDREASDYHVHTQIGLRRGQIRASVRWVAGALKPPAAAEPPFAEDVSAWIWRYFARAARTVSSFGYFRFRSSRYESALGLPLPWPVRGAGVGRTTVVGMTATASVPRAHRATVDTQAGDGPWLWVTLRALYGPGAPDLEPSRLLREYDKVLAIYILRKVSRSRR